jgi:hypothetical protein
MAAGLLLMLVSFATTAAAQRAIIPNSVMPGRERELFTDLPTPKSTVGGIEPLPGNGSYSIRKRTHSSAVKTRRRHAK